ncbi:MAG: hypothetical protein GTO14_17280 [Anaerolineales bacterium]|nr:hypothetical protein [Anaerolineales bacterium]
MRNLTNLQLEQLIVHILDPWSTTGLVLSERVLPLETQSNVRDYFLTHIKNSLRDPSAKVARFLTFNRGDTSTICNALLDGNLDLVSGSIQLAQKLYAILQSDRRISTGDLAVGFCRGSDRSSVRRFLALLKIDPTEVFRHKTERDEENKLYVGFEPESDVLPSTREKLQKCAFIQPLDQRPDYDMFLLDRQVRPLPVPIAKFFSETFLGAELALDERQRTDRLYRGLISAYNQMRQELKPAEEEHLRAEIHGVVDAASVDFDSWLKRLRLPEERKTQIDQVVTQILPDREFEVDRSYALRLIQKRRFRGDHGLRVEVSADHYQDVIPKVEQVEDQAGQTSYRIVIHTRRWEEWPK